MKLLNIYHRAPSSHISLFFCMRVCVCVCTLPCVIGITCKLTTELQGLDSFIGI